MKRRLSGAIRKSLPVLGVLALHAPAGAARPPRADTAIAFAIPAGSLQQALVAYADATGIELLYASALVRGRTAPRLAGRFAPDTALTRLLAGSGLAARRVSARVWVIEASAPPPPAASEPAPAAPATAAAEPPEPRATEAGMAPATPAPVPPAAAPADIVVTGTHIRGGNPGTPPVTTITRDDLVRNGHATVAQALQALPGNFGGMATEQSALAFADPTSSNAGLGTGVNLRGLGAGATLVLVDGQRLAGSGTLGAFSDVSSIPTGALDRVEVLMDGASAIYGSDAVGGVVNIRLRRHFDGAETRVRLGSVTAGGKRDLQLDQTLGRTWATGGVMLSYEYSRTGRLASADRAFARSADSRPLGGTDHRAIFSLPGNVLGIDPQTGALGPAFAIRPGQDGTARTAADFARGLTNLQNIRADTDLIPRQERHSVFASLDQQVGAGLRLTVDARYAHRGFDARGTGSAAIVQISAANPYFVSPTGAASDLIAYSLAPEIGPSDTHGFAEALAVSAGLDADLGARWKLRSYAAFAQERERSTSDHLVNTAALAEAAGTVPDNPATPFRTAVDGFFNPYGTGASNGAAILAFVGSGYSIARTRSRVLTGHVDADGPLLDLPGGVLRLAVGGDLRREEFTRSGASLLSSATPIATAHVDGHHLIEAGFAELHVPLFGPANARPGLRRLDLSVAARIEHYADFGTTTNPKIGLAWVPATGIVLRSSYGTSFRAPNLRELVDAQRVSVTSLRQAGGTTIPVIQLSGGNPALRPETARSWTAGIDLDPAMVPRLHLTATWFRTVFRRRIGTPANSNFNNALTDPSLAPFVERVAPATSPADLARVTALLASPAFSGGNSFPPSSIGAIIDTRYVNTGKVDASGVDLTIRYTIPAGSNRFELAANGTWLTRFREQLTPTAAAIDQRNRVAEPVELRGRLSAGWTRGIANALAGLNYVAPYHDLLGHPIRAWTTVDLPIGLKLPAGHGPLAGTDVALVATNILAAAPPFYDSPAGVGYDATNADALGRFVALQLTRRW